MRRWIICAWRGWIQCIVCSSAWHPLPLHYHDNWIFRRPHYFCHGYIQWISQYYFTPAYKNSVSKFTLSISGLAQNKMAKSSISIKKLEGIMHPCNKTNLTNNTCWKILVWITKINLHHCKHDKKLFWSFCILTGLQKLQIIPFY